jgi:hypothetical protein
MQQITDRLPEIDIYQRIYADTMLGEMLAKAYVQVISLSQSAIDYLQSPGYSK